LQEGLSLQWIRVRRAIFAYLRLTRRAGRAMNIRTLVQSLQVTTVFFSHMSMNIHENRFMERLQFAVGDAEVAQELSIPRKARRLDVVCQFTEAPALFGALQAECANRTVVFEHESEPLSEHAVASAWHGMSWLLWDRVRPVRKRERSAHHILKQTERPPLAIVVADAIHRSLQGAVPSLRPLQTPGLWSTPNLEEGGLLVVDTSRVRKQENLAWWSWLGRAANDDDQRNRLRALLTDPNLPINQLESLQEAIMNGQLTSSTTERETVAQRVRREAREDGIRESMLALVRQVAPERIREFEAIEDALELQRAALALVRR
jgi:hypothetical protein